MTAWLGEGRAEGGAVTLTPSQSGEGGLRSWRQLNQLNCTQTGLRAGLGLGFEAAARGRLLDSGRDRGSVSRWLGCALPGPARGMGVRSHSE